MRVSWSEDMVASHLEVRPAGREDSKKAGTVVIEGPEARSQRDWVYWLLPTVCSAQVKAAQRILKVYHRSSKRLLRVFSESSKVYSECAKRVGRGCKSAMRLPRV
jgi:hypothetical protein